MKKIILMACLVLASASAMAQEVKKLPEPNKKVKMTLFEALQQRKSVRTYSDKDIDDMKLSQLLWAAVGINRADGRLTSPTAINAQDITVYVCRKDGAWLYNAKDNSLTKVSDKDLRQAAASRQAFSAKAPITLVLVSDNAKLRGKNNDEPTLLGAMDAGYVSQNIDLACEALGLATVPRATMEKDTLKKELKLAETQNAVLNHPIGYPK